ncbi:MAG TPA: sigma 54-interacting transcriptional regulator [Kofleriaceae bacterium]|nr:sigma 54-interacting transcriptional regulator [Kofleriaceae bacterium]
MGTEHLTIDAGTLVASSREPQVFLVVQLGEGEQGSRVVELADGGEVTFGRSRGAVIAVPHDSVSRMHARVRRSGETIEVEDLGSRNGTWVNGERISGTRRLVAGDELAIGSIHAVLGSASGLRRASPVVEPAAGEARLAAEVDRSVRYRRPVTFALVRIAAGASGRAGGAGGADPVDTALEAIAGILRPMDLIAEYAGDDYLVILPELDRATGTAAMASIIAAARGAGASIAAGTVVCPEEATTAEVVIAALRASLAQDRPGASGRPGASTASGVPAASSSSSPAPGASTASSAPVAPIAPGGPIVIDPVMQRVYKLVAKIAGSSMTVLILGETGVGKELVAEAIHRDSARRDGPMIKLNCAALPETLLESELFGHERGAFTGADRRKQGFFEAASGGTLFLDEVGEMPPALQAKLLRVLENKVITRLGGTTEISTDVRVVAATHRDLQADVRVGRFRQDLLFRIGGFTIAVPPLRDRKSEIVPLAEHFARSAAAEQSRPAPALSPEVRDALLAYRWPGNVRELENAIERALVLCDGAIALADLPDRVRDVVQRTGAVTATADIHGQLADVERGAIAAALEAHGDNQTHAARALGLSRRALIYKMEKYGLKPPPGAAPTRRS